MKKVGTYLGLLSVCLMLFSAAFFSAELSDGIRNGIDLCFNLLIPSMLVFLILSHLCMNSAIGQLLSRPFSKLLCRMFRIPESAVVILLLSLIGGYPVGARLLSEAVRTKRLSSNDAERMLAFCVNCGPAFLISGVGVRLFGSLSLGLLLYFSQVIACLSVGFLSSRKTQSISQQSTLPPTIPRQHISVLLVESVNSAGRSMGVICLFVVAFSSLLPLVSRTMQALPNDVSYLVGGLLEVTSGCQNLHHFESLNRILMAALFTSFGGVCVLLQICAMLHGSGISLRRFFLWRIPYTIISLLVTRLGLACLPGLVETMSLHAGVTPRLYSTSPAATFFLILLCIMLLFFRDKSGKIKKTLRI